jgi:DNA-binding NarL/FixJ family response regulator
LQLSVKTVEAHRSNVMRKMEIGSLAGLVRYAIRNKIVDA